MKEAVHIAGIVMASILVWESAKRRGMVSESQVTTVYEATREAMLGVWGYIRATDGAQGTLPVGPFLAPNQSMGDGVVIAR